MVAYYPFSGNANDISGNNNNPIFNNAVLVNDRFGNTNRAYHFNGIDNYMRIPNNSTLNFSNQMSLVTWVRPTGFYYGPCHGNSVLAKGDDQGDFIGRYVIRFEDGQFLNNNNCGVPIPDTVHEDFWSSDAYLPGGYTPFVAKNLWQSVIYTSDGVRSKLFINCQLVIDVPAAAGNFNNVYDLYFGKINATSFEYWFNGDLDDIRIYNRALNDQEVTFVKHLLYL